MIKLERPPCPTFLTPAKAKELTDKFKDDGSSVWSAEEIKTPLLASSSNKCAYCECGVNEESKYMEVEHFKDKDSYPDDVVSWINLLPSCKRCNGTKGTHDVLSTPIINPYDVVPSQHLGFRAYRFRPLTSLGKDTVDALDLNNSLRVVLTRFKVGEDLLEELEVVSDRWDAWVTKGTTRARNALIRGVDALLQSCQPTEPYAATAATVLHQDERYRDLRTDLMSHGLWTAELENSHLRSLALRLPCT